MDDSQILDTIHRLVEDEHEAREQRRAGQLSRDGERQALGRLEETLDQCWDLLRQRRARADVGEDPDAAATRPVSEVEGYQQ
ncbi:MAG: DUF2630 family protein [Streptosporangiales bacterium]